jgi:hypothetical protein
VVILRKKIDEMLVKAKDKKWDENQKHFEKRIVKMHESTGS